MRFRPNSCLDDRALGEFVGSVHRQMALTMAVIALPSLTLALMASMALITMMALIALMNIWPLGLVLGHGPVLVYFLNLLDLD